MVHRVLPDGWKARTLRGLKSLAVRVAALGGRVYNGFGFHAEMVRETKYLTRLVPTLHETIDAGLSGSEKSKRISEAIVAEVRYADLVRDVANAERDADRWDREHPNWKSNED